jgi:hypothetical protein
MVLWVFFMSAVVAADATRVGEATAYFEPQDGCVTKRVIVSKARAGDAASPEPWEQRDGSFVRARVVRDGTVEVERCVCGRAGALPVRVLVEKRKE